jgi:hypothetical protein
VHDPVILIDDIPGRKTEDSVRNDPMSFIPGIIKNRPGMIGILISRQSLRGYTTGLRAPIKRGDQPNPYGVPEEKGEPHQGIG